jgi:hypothetical protein
LDPDPNSEVHNAHVFKLIFVSFLETLDGIETSVSSQEKKTQKYEGKKNLLF